MKSGHFVGAAPYPKLSTVGAVFAEATRLACRRHGIAMPASEERPTVCVVEGALGRQVVLIQRAHPDDPRGAPYRFAMHLDAEGFWTEPFADGLDWSLRYGAAMAARRAAAPSETRDLPAALWSTHPVVAAALALRGEVPAITISTMARFPAGPKGHTPRLPLKDAGQVFGAMLAPGELVVRLVRAVIHGSDGRPAMGLFTRAGTLSATLPGEWPETLAQALPGRTAGDLAAFLAADPRAAAVPIAAATAHSRSRRPRLTVEFGDACGPLAPGADGGEPWRPASYRGPWAPADIDRADRDALLDLARRGAPMETASRRRWHVGPPGADRTAATG